MLDRRRFLASVGGPMLAGASLSQQKAISQESQNSQISEKYGVIDTHFHLFNTSPGSARMRHLPAGGDTCRSTADSRSRPVLPNRASRQGVR